MENSPSPGRASGLSRLALLLSEWFGCGRSPFAPGTVGALGALPLYWLLRDQSSLIYWLSVSVISVVGIAASNRAAALLQDEDPSRVVIDEVAGVLIALGFVRGQAWWLEAIAWLLFRAFDIGKPGPVDRVQYLSPPGLGIMADDILAGIFAGLVAFGIAWAFPF